MNVNANTSLAHLGTSSLPARRPEASQRSPALSGSGREARTKEIEELQKRLAELEGKYQRMKRINEKLVAAMENAKVPIPDLNGDLTDSVKGLKWKK